MPLDGHSFLVEQGWGGHGTALRQGALSRPLAIPQKRNFAGLGKDRDEAFPFWDHLFSVAAKSIQVKLSGSDDSETDEEDSETKDNVEAALSGPVLKRTTTGILCNRRPVKGCSATSGTSTPSDAPRKPQQYNLLARAKREAARCGLYSRFFRGPILVSEQRQLEENPKLNSSSSTPLESVSSTAVVESADEGKAKNEKRVTKKGKEKDEDGDVKRRREKRKTRKEGGMEEAQDIQRKRERKRRRMEAHEHAGEQSTRNSLPANHEDDEEENKRQLLRSKRKEAKRQKTQNKTQRHECESQDNTRRKRKRDEALGATAHGEHKVFVSAVNSHSLDEASPPGGEQDDSRAQKKHKRKKRKGQQDISE